MATNPYIPCPLVNNYRIDPKDRPRSRKPMSDLAIMPDPIKEIHKFMRDSVSPAESLLDNFFNLCISLFKAGHTQVAELEVLGDAIKFEVYKITKELLIGGQPVNWNNGAFREIDRRAQSHKIYRILLIKWPQLEMFVKSLRYAGAGGPHDPRGRYVPVGVSEYFGRSWEPFLARIGKQSRPKIHHATMAAWNDRVEWAAKVAEQVTRLPFGKKLKAHRYSSGTGLIQARLQNSSIYYNQLDSAGEYHFVASARKSATAVNRGLVKAALAQGARTIVFDSPDRLGREYYEENTNFLKKLGFELEFEQDLEPDHHLEPTVSKIQAQNAALDGYVTVTEEQAKSTILSHMKEAVYRIGNKLLIHRDLIDTLGLSFCRKVVKISKYSISALKLIENAIFSDQNIMLVAAGPP